MSMLKKFIVAGKQVSADRLFFSRATTYQPLIKEGGLMMSIELLSSTIDRDGKIRSYTSDCVCHCELARISIDESTPQARHLTLINEVNEYVRAINAACMEFDS